jgi:hypothetical protein
MNRLARVVALNGQSVTLKLLKSENCAGCPSNCNEPLIDLFSLKSNQLIMNTAAKHYQLTDPDGILLNPNYLNHTINFTIEEQDLLKSSGMLYLLPLIACLMFLTMGHYLGGYLGWSQDVTALLGLMVGLFVSYVLLKNKKLKENLNFRPKVTILVVKGT